MKITDEMVDAAFAVAPLNYFQPRGDGEGFPRCSINTGEIRTMLEAALSVSPPSAEKGGRCPKCGAGKLGNCGYHGAEIPREMCPLGGASDALEKALEWYGEQAEAMARHTIAINPKAMEAIVTCLSLDGGNRARAALSSYRKED